MGGKMGGWAKTLFSSNYDHEIIRALSNEAGLQDLEKSDPDKNASYSIYAKLCSNHEMVRKHLDAGTLAVLVVIYMVKITAPGAKKDEYPPGYILLAPGAMTLGCSLPPSFKNWLDENFDKVGLMHDAVTQMKTALGGAYKDGTPYNFGSKTLLDTMELGGPSNNEITFPYSSSIASISLASAPRRGDNPVDLSREVFARIVKRRDAGDFDHPANSCGNCGAQDGEQAKVLLTCAKCGEKKYCGKECQKKHWKKHKTVCMAPEHNWER